MPGVAAGSDKPRRYRATDMGGRVATDALRPLIGRVCPSRERMSSIIFLEFEEIHPLTIRGGDPGWWSSVLASFSLAEAPE